jgi:signal peptidase I
MNSPNPRKLSEEMDLNWQKLDVIGTKPAAHSSRKTVTRLPSSQRIWGQYKRTPKDVAVSLFKQFFQVVLVAVLALGSYWFFSTNVLQSVEVIGASMAPTLHDSDHYLLNRWKYLLHDPEPNDIVVIRDPEDGKFSVKRVIGCAGDSILLKEGRVFINGRELKEPYLAPGTPTYASLTREGEQWIVCGKNHYFVLGDNRRNSEDSRRYGPVSRKDILGAVIY